MDVRRVLERLRGEQEPLLAVDLSNQRDPGRRTVVFETVGYGDDRMAGHAGHRVDRPPRRHDHVEILEDGRHLVHVEPPDPVRLEVLDAGHEVRSPQLAPVALATETGVLAGPLELVEAGGPLHVLNEVGEPVLRDFHRLQVVTERSQRLERPAGVGHRGLAFG